MNTTTKKFYRTMTEAFPDQRAACIEPPPKRTVYAVINWLLAAAIAFVLVLITLENLA